jgi:hypothetical protein
MDEIITTRADWVHEHWVKAARSIPADLLTRARFDEFVATEGLAAAEKSIRRRWNTLHSHEDPMGYWLGAAGDT